MGLPDLMHPSVAFNAVDHFTVLTSGISPEMHSEAISVLDKAINGKPLLAAPKPSYATQLEFWASRPTWAPTTTPPKPPQVQLSDPSDPEGAHFTATSRLDHDLIGVFAARALPYTFKSSRRLCEFRLERGNVLTDTSLHAPYLAQAESSINVIIRGRLMVDGFGNLHSYFTNIQENLHTPHYNCTYSYQEGKIWIIQTTPAANEELSIQYTADGSFWKDRASDFPLELYTLACVRYALPIPVPVVVLAHDLVSPPAVDFTDDFMDAQYAYRFLFCPPPL